MAKPRSQLPHLYYPRNDSVRIINSHLGGDGGIDLSVDGKAPMSGWVPSLDDSGNGTDSLNDLVGDNDGTLFGMTPETAWVVDTDAGGSRALQFDGVDDYVEVGQAPALTSTAFSISLWLKWNGAITNSNRGLVAKYGSNARGWGLSLANLASNVPASNAPGTVVFYYQSSASEFDPEQVLNSVHRVDSNTWRHVMAVFVPSTSVSMYVDGVLRNQETSGIPASVASNTAPVKFASYGGGNYFAGRLDDIRIFSQALDADDAAHLATNRGVQP